MFDFKKKNNKPKILIVDDEQDLLKLVSKQLEWNGYTTVCASNGQEGLEKAASERPDIILLGINMPIMNGPDTLKILKSTPDLSDIPVIMLTANFNTEDIESAISCGIEDYVTKPFEPDYLIQKISSALAKQKN